MALAFYLLVALLRADRS
ncbi:hypothetical protein [Pseudomonas sp. RW405]